MSRELINRITIKKDGVYISSHSSNDSSSFHSHKIETLSNIYFTDGEKALTIELLRLFHDCADVSGHHKSVEKYRHIFSGHRDEWLDYIRKINALWDNLSKQDRDSVYSEPTHKAQEYLKTISSLEKEYYEKIAEEVLSQK